MARWDGMDLGPGGLTLAAAGGGPVWAAVTAETVAQFRARPAVVMIGVAVGATAQVRCGAGAPVPV